MRELDTLLRDIENEVDSNKIEKAIEKVIEIRDRELEKRIWDWPIRDAGLFYTSEIEFIWKN